MSVENAVMIRGPLVVDRREKGVASLFLNNPERFNPLSSAMIAALEEELTSIAGDADARVVVIGAHGRGFCAGHDLKELRAHANDAEWQRRLFDDCSRLMVALTRLPQPVIARVQGIATAAGCQLVSMCDLAVASETATFALPGVNIGVFCSTPVVGVVRNVGRKRAMEMLLTGRPIAASTALEWGLVNQVVPAGELDGAVRGYVDLILARSAAAIRIGKRTFYGQVDRTLDAAYELAGEAMVRNMLMKDASEGIDAFFEKRPASWTGE
jgi:enoyl-CoA hydratase/carnithine racemase